MTAPATPDYPGYTQGSSPDNRPAEGIQEGMADAVPTQAALRDLSGGPAADAYLIRPQPWSFSAWILSANLWLVFLFFYAPIVILIVFSFNSGRYTGYWQGFSLEWYVRLFENQQMSLALRNSMIVGGISTVFSTVLGTLVALGMSRFRFRGKSALDSMLYLPIIIPDIVMGVMLLIFFVQAGRALGVFGIGVSLGLTTIILGHIAFNVSFVAVLVRARLADFDRSLEEAAGDLYANSWQTFRFVTLPLIAPGILAGALLAFTLSLDDFVITFFTSGPGSTTLPLQIYSMVRTGVTPEINALSTLMLVASMILVGASLALQRR